MQCSSRSVGARENSMIGEVMAKFVEVRFRGFKNIASCVKYEYGEAKSGVPLGGLGTGSVVLGSTGSFSASTLRNNIRDRWNPWGSFFAIYTSSGGKSQCKVLGNYLYDPPLQELSYIFDPSLKSETRIQSLEYYGHYPMVDIKFEVEPVEVNMQAFTPFIPGDSKNSGIPAAIFYFDVKNIGGSPCEVSIAFSWGNDIPSQGKQLNRFQSKDGIRGLFYTAEGTRDSYALIYLGDAELTYLAAWNPYTSGMGFLPAFSKEGRLPNVASSEDVDYRSPAGALAAKTSLKPDETKTLCFVLAWYFPNLTDSSGAFLGHMYSNWFSDAWDVARYVAENLDSLYKRTVAWQDEIYGSDLPYWLKDALINSLYSLARNTFWIKDGRFGHSESFASCPIMETIVCRFYGSIPIAMMFPDIEFNVMYQFAKHQRDDGAIPFALGRPEFFDRPYYEVQKSINSSEFVLMACRDYLWTGDKEFLDRIYPHVKKAVYYAKTLDTDNDHVVNEVSMQYYDCWRFYGTSTYVGTIWLACLKAAEKLARIKGDKTFAENCKKWFNAGLKSFEEKLWNGEYYSLYNEPETGRASDTCLGNQLVGQWYAYLIGLGEFLPKDHIISVIKAVKRLNVAATKYGVVNGVKPNGKIDYESHGHHSDSITIGESFCYAATCIYAGEKDLGLEVAKKTYENIALNQKTPWNITWNVSPADGSLRWGTEYYSNMVVWTLYHALTGKLFSHKR